MYKFYIWFIANFIKKKKLRQRFRRFKWYKHCIEKYKFGVSYSVFDGEELLEASIKSIRESVDYVNVVYQTISWKGNPADEGLLPLLKKLKNTGLIDELIYFEPDLSKKAGLNERNKRNIGLKAAHKAGVDYFMPMDCDEFYKKDEIEYAKRVIFERNIKRSYVSICGYGTIPTQMSIIPCRASVQFFSKINIFSYLKHDKRSIAVVDSTRELSSSYFAKKFYINGCQMHHYSLIRKNLVSKYENSSWTKRKVNVQKLLADDEFDKVTVPDYFGLNEKCTNIK